MGYLIVLVALASAVAVRSILMFGFASYFACFGILSFLFVLGWKQIEAVANAMSDFLTH